MNEMQIFTNVEFGNVRTLWENGKPLFCGTDVAQALGYKNSNKAVNDHCRAITKRSSPTSGKMQEINFISEGDVYRLIARSNLPTAERFEQWIFDEILPSVNKHGIYAVPETIEAMISDPDTMIKVLQTLKAEKEALVATQRQLDEAITRLDESADWLSIKRVASLNNMSSKDLDYRQLKAASKIMCYPVKKVTDQNYGEVNAYNIEVWRKVYSGLIYYPLA